MELLDKKFAEEEFQRWIDLMDIDMDVEGLDENTARDRLEEKRIVVRAIRRQMLAVEDDGTLIFNVSEGSPIKIKRPRISARRAMDRKKDSHMQGKMLAYMSAVTGVSDATLNKMYESEGKVLQSLFSLFLG